MENNQKEKLKQLLNDAIPSYRFFEKIKPNFKDKKYYKINQEEYAYCFFLPNNDSRKYHILSLYIEIENEEIKNKIEQLVLDVFKDFTNSKKHILPARLNHLPFEIDYFINNLLKYSFVYGSDKVVEILAKQFKEDKVFYNRLSLIKGLKVKRTLSIFDGIIISPAEKYFNILPSFKFHSDNDLSSISNWKSYSIIDISFFRTPFMIRVPDESEYIKDTSKLHNLLREYKYKVSNNDFSNFNSKDFINCLYLVLKKPCSLSLEWDFELYNFFGVGNIMDSNSMLNYVERGYHIPPIQLNEEDLEKTKKLYRKFYNLDKDIKKKIDIAMRRLIPIKDNWSIVDSIINLGIALEVIYLGGSKEQLSLALRTRGAWYLGGDFQQRKETYDTLKEFYEFRSRAVHSGSLSDKDHESINNNFEKTRIICCNTLEKIINDSKIPNWDNIILGKL